MTESIGDTAAGDTRRRFLRLAGSAAVVGVAGCAGPGDGEGETTAEPETTTEPAAATDAEGETTAAGNETAARNETAAGNETATGNETAAGNETDAAAGGPDLSGPVPEEYATATSLGGTERNPDALQTKEAVRYQSEPSDGQQCSDCTFYVEDMNGDGLGACAIVEGLIEPEGWCVSFAPYEG